MAILLAADIGGSKTALRVFREDGKVLAVRNACGAGFSQDSCEDIPALSEALTALVREFPDIAATAVNLGGKNREQIESIFRKALPGTRLAVYRESEAAAALAFGQKVDAPVVLLAGTGTIAVAAAENGVVIGGGWGANIGDGGSGYDIGLETLRYCLCCLDRQEPLSPLVQQVTGESQPLCVTSAEAYCVARDAVRQRLQPFDRAHIASLTRICAQHAAAGEADALMIFREAGLRMGRLVADTARKAGHRSLSGVAVSGGLCNIRAFFSETFQDTVQEVLPTERFIYSADGVLQGACILARQLL